MSSLFIRGQEPEGEQILRDVWTQVIPTDHNIGGFQSLDFGKDMETVAHVSLLQCEQLF